MTYKDTLIEILTVQVDELTKDNEELRQFDKKQSERFNTLFNNFSKLRGELRKAKKELKYYKEKEDPTPTEHYLTLTQEENEARLEENLNDKN